MARKQTAAPVDDDDDDVAELTDLTDDDADEAPAKKAKAEDEGFGVRSLIALIKEKYGKEYSPREVRTLLRKLAREDKTIDREIIAGNKTRYNWTGPDDPEVKAVLKAVKGGQIEASKKAALDKLKSDKAAKNAAKAAAEAPAKGKKAPAPDPDDDDDD